MYTTISDTKTTFTWAGYMKMTGGVTYNFKGCYDDYATVKVAGTWVVAQGGDCKEVSGSFTPTDTDWYAIEFRVGNNGGAGGCQNSSEYGILWSEGSDENWRQVFDSGDGSLFKTGSTTAEFLPVEKTTPLIISSQMRKTDLTIMDVMYIVLSPHETVNVRALAFENGERSFQYVVRPETFVKDTNGVETACNVGDGIAANVPLFDRMMREEDCIPPDEMSGWIRASVGASSRSVFRAAGQYKI